MVVVVVLCLIMTTTNVVGQYESRDESSENYTFPPWDFSSDNEYDPCDPNPCENDGECYETSYGWECNCPVGWSGYFCHIPSSTGPCACNPCLNGALCFVESEDDYYCDCAEGYSGNLCESGSRDNDACAHNPCFNGGSCFGNADNGDFDCLCSVEYTGIHCETAMIFPCDPDPCEKGRCSRFEATAIGFECICDYGYNGTLCDHDYLEPEIFCEAGQSIQLQAGESSRAIYWDEPTTFDNSEDDGREVHVSCSPPSRTTFYEGETMVQCDAVDEAGNVASCRFDITLTELSVPEIECPGDLTHPTAAGESYATVDYATPRISRADDYNCRPVSGSNFNTGDNTVTCQTYSNGVSARCNFNIHVRDNQRPTITCPEDTFRDSAYQAVYNQIWWSPPVVEDNSGLYIAPSCDPPSGSVFNLGNHYVVCYASDIHGNENSCSFVVTVQDTQPPQIVCPGRQIQSTDDMRATAEVSFEPQAWDNSDGYVNVECDPREGHFPIGTSDVTCVASDEDGNQAECSFEVVIYDNEAPDIGCPVDMSVQRPISLVGSTTGVTVDWSVKAWDNSGDAPETYCVPNQDWEFQFGTTTVVCNARDGSHNRESCQFDVEVTDQDVPLVICPPDTTLNADPGQDDVAVVWATPTTITATETDGISCNPDSGSRFVIGGNRVDCLATNVLGVSSGCGFYINVLDEEDPVITCPSNQILSSTDGGKVMPIYTDNNGPSYTDNSGYGNMWCEPDLNTAFDIGNWYITCYAEDFSGNDAQCTFKVQVNDDETDYCSGDPCNGHGQCINLEDGFHCICDEGYFGEQCELDVCDIEGDPCNSNGECFVEGSVFTCNCLEGWYGDYCDLAAPCGVDPACNGNGDCVMDGADYRCDCYEGWMGETCGEMDDGGVVTPGKRTGDNSIGIIAGGAAGGLVFLILLIVLIVYFVLRSLRSKPPKKLSAAAEHYAESAEHYAESDGVHHKESVGLPLKEKSLSEKNGLHNQGYGSSSHDPRYDNAILQVPNISVTVQPTAPPPPMSRPPSTFAPPPPPTGSRPPPPPVSNKPQGKKIPPRLPSMTPSAIYNDNGSISYDRGGSTATYGAYEQPGMAPIPEQNGADGENYANNIYEDIDIYLDMGSPEGAKQVPADYDTLRP